MTYLVTDEAIEVFFNDIYTFYEQEDWLRIVGSNRDKIFEAFINDIENHTETWGLRYLEPLALISKACVKLNDFSSALKNYTVCKAIFDNIELTISDMELNLNNLSTNANQIDQEVIQDFNSILKNLKDFANSNITFKKEVYYQLGYCQLNSDKGFENENINQSIKYYNEALALAAKDTSSNNELSKIKIKLGLSEAYYEHTKKRITYIKIIFFLLFLNAFLWCNPIMFKINPFTNVNLSSVWDWLFFLLILALLATIILIIPFSLYKLFYIVLRKLRKWISRYFLCLFTKSFNRYLSKLLCFINGKKMFDKGVYKIHEKAIEDIEKIENKDFDTYFAICKLYYYLGQYKNATFYAQSALSLCKNNNNESECLALVYHYLARIAFKKGNHSMAIAFYDKTIKNLIEQEENNIKIHQKPNTSDKIKKFIDALTNKKQAIYKIHAIPNLADMIKYSQQNRDAIEKTTFSRTYLPVIITLIFTMMVGIAQIYFSIDYNKDIASEFCQKHFPIKKSLK